MKTQNELVNLKDSQISMNMLLDSDISQETIHIIQRALVDCFDQKQRKLVLGIIGKILPGLSNAKKKDKGTSTDVISQRILEQK